MKKKSTVVERKYLILFISGRCGKRPPALAEV